MRPVDRQQRIVEMVQSRGRVMVDELAILLDASQETIRRDLGTLAARGAVRKFHGGAALPMTQVEGPYDRRMIENAPAKRAIARLAASLFKPGDTIFIDTGTTTVFFAEELAWVAGITVITNSATIAGKIARTERGARVFLIGGEYVEEASEVVGPLAIEQIRRFHADHVVLTVGAIDVARGVMDYNIEEAEIARAMIAQAKTLTVLADASKLGRSALFEVCPVDRIHRLVTDMDAPRSLVDELLTLGIVIHRAPV